MSDAIPAPINHTVAAIDAAWEAAAREARRTYLGASAIGSECERALWYDFRWANKPERLSGRKLRLFNTGHVEEGRMVEDLRRAGIKVEDRDPATGDQWALEDCDGHFRGHMDGKVTGLPEAPKAGHVLECKTHNEKSFKDLVKHGVGKSKPQHMAQMQVYMHLSGESRALYLAKNKNDDELYAERVEYDAAHALALIAKAARIINADHPPAKLHEDPSAKAAFACGWCPAKAVCHEGAFAEHNCRTCIHVAFVPGGVTRCTKFEKTLSRAEQAAGCTSHRYLPGLVPGEQIDIEGEDVIVYRLASGETFKDGGA